MALSSQTISAAILAAAPELVGVTSLPTVSGIALGVLQWITLPANFALTGVTTGVVGTGQVVGKVTVPPNPGAVVGSLASAGVIGQTASILGRGVAVGIATAVSSSAQYQGPSVGVAIGSDVAAVAVSNGPSLVGSLSSALISFYGGSGPSLAVIAQGLGTGIALMLSSSVGVGVVTGTPVSYTPSVGSSPLSTVF